MTMTIWKMRRTKKKKVCQECWPSLCAQIRREYKLTDSFTHCQLSLLNLVTANEEEGDDDDGDDDDDDDDDDNPSKKQRTE
jgi:hypothetical protein